MMHLAVREDDIVKAESLVARVGKDYADSAMFGGGGDGGENREQSRSESHTGPIIAPISRKPRSRSFPEHDSDRD